MSNIKRNFPWFSIFNIGMVLVAIPIVNPWIRRNGDSTFAMIVGVGLTLLAIFLIDLIVLMTLKIYIRAKKKF